jgi:hypothetical protein
MALTVEVGGDPKLGADHDEGGFIPDYVKHFPKLEREIHVAAWAFLSAVASMKAQPPSTPDPPVAPPPPATGSGAGCLLMMSALLGGGALAGYLARRRS